MTHGIPARVFESVVEAQGIATSITDAALDGDGPRIVFVNDAFTRLTGYGREELVGRSHRILQGPLTDRSAAAKMQRRLEDGGHFVTESINYRSDGTPFVMRWSISPVGDIGLSGSTQYFVAAHNDVTGLRLLERYRTADRQIAKTAIALAADQALEAVAVIVTKQIHDIIERMLYVGRACVVAQVAGQWITGPDVAAAERLRLAELVESTAVPMAFTSGREQCLVAPLEGSRIPGAIVVDEIGSAEMNLVSLDHLADLAATTARGLSALDMMANRRREALAVQRVLLPTEQYDIDGFRIFAHYSPSRRSEEAGGDWYDVVEVENSIRAVIGDVVGKGMLAAAEMGLIRAHMNALLSSEASLEAVIAETDSFCRSESIVATTAIADIDRHSGEFHIVAAGHPPPVLVCNDSARFIELSPVPPLGAFAEPAPAPAVTTGTLAEHAIVLYTDGLLNERRDGLDKGLEGLLATYAACGNSLEDVAQATVDATNTSRDDDVAALVLTLTST